MALRRVMVENGEVEGLPCGNNTITVFKGIPYAKPPVGDLRWKAPQPAEDWEGVYPAYKFRSIIAQAVEDHTFYSKEFYPYREEMDEDGLYLNIWTPAASDEEKLPVMMYIHGGAFTSGFSYEIEFDGEAFAKRGVILCTITYRLGALGYLAHPLLTAEGGEKSSGNYGVLDQIMALKWLRKNITAFGGDPDRITIFGESAGGMSVLNLVTTELTRGDISGAIMLSGGGYTGDFSSSPDRLTLSKAEALGQKFFAHLGVKTLEEARALPFRKIIEAQREITGSALMLFSPIVDGYVHPVPPSEVIAAGKQHNITYMVGHTGFENSSYAFVPEFSMTPDQMEKIAREKYGKLAGKFLKAAGFFEDPQEAVYHGGLDDELVPPINAWCRIQAERGKKTWYYRFNRKFPFGTHQGAYHASESWFVFGTIQRCWRPLDGKDYDLSLACNSYFANFAKKGDPNGEGLEEWKPYSKECPMAMELGYERKMISEPITPRQEFIVRYLLGELNG